jgi:hypothetical protein
VNQKLWRLVTLAALAVSFSIGCGSTTTATSSQSSPPTQPLSNVSGQYDLVLTSSNGRGTTNIYTNFTQTGTAFAGAANTLVCLSNDLSKCEGDGSSATSIAPAGTISGTNVTIVISFPTTTGADTVTMVGSLTGTSLAGTFTDSLGDSGTWTASTAIYPFGPPPGVYDYSGTFNSISNPLLIAPNISIELGKDASFNSSTILKGTAIVMNWPCVSSLNFSGQAIGDAFSLTDTTSKVSIIALPTLPTGNSFIFSYKFEPVAASCAGDFGRGVLTINSQPWDY